MEDVVIKQGFQDLLPNFILFAAFGQEGLSLQI
jgi:hypothetical protein